MPKINVNIDIQEVRLKDLVLAPYDPREISSEALKGLQKSLERFGLLELMVVNKRNMHIIAGNKKYPLLMQDGIEVAPALMVDVDELSEIAMNLTLNSSQIMGVWTKAIIPLLEKLKLEAHDDYISLRMNKLRDEVSKFEPENTGAGKTLPDDIPLPPEETITKPGDLWILGDHRLLCGDSTNEKDVERLMNGEKASLFATDPPYCVDYVGNDRPTGGKDWSDVYHEVDIDDAEDFMRRFYTVGFKHIKPNTALYLWHASSRIVMIKKICEELGIVPHQPIIWVKPCAVLTYSFYSWRHEPCLLMWIKGQKPPYKPKDKSIGSVWTTDYIKSMDPSTPEYYTDVWELDWEGKKRNPGLKHPTVKPTEVFAIPMRVHTSIGDVCYEPFSGSGSQIIAAERLGRRCYAMELEPVFCDVAVKRWEDFTGLKAHLETERGADDRPKTKSCGIRTQEKTLIID